MRPLHLKITAMGLLAACAILITRRTAEPEFSTDEAGTALRVVKKKTDGWVAGDGITVIFGQEPANRFGGGVYHQGHAGVTPVNGRHAATITHGTMTDEEDKVGIAEMRAKPALPLHRSRPIGIQLGEDVRLPAALMNLSENGLLLDAHNVSPVVTAAREQIANSFYRELADHALAPATAGDARTLPQHEPSESDDDASTVVIAAGPQVEVALERADEIYRVFYGDEAYNRYSMGSAVEVRLPAADVVEGAE